MNARSAIPAIASSLVLLVLPSCNNSTEPEVNSDFFPSMAIGDIISWDYKYEYISGFTLIEGLVGTMKWTIAAAYDSSGTRVLVVRQEFTGLLDKLRSDTPYVRDTVYIQSDTTSGSINEDPSHTVKVTTWATGREATYGGREVTFPRYPSGVQGDVLEVTTTGGGGGYGTTVRAQRNLGLIYYYNWSGPGITKYRTTLNRR